MAVLKQIITLVVTLAIMSLAVVTQAQAQSKAKPPAAETSAQRSVGFFNFTLINTTIEPAGDDEFHRIDLLNGILADWFEKSEKFKLVAIPDTVMKQVKAGQDFGSCACEAAFGKKVGADLVAWGTVEKISNLILNINVYISDTETNNYVFVKSVDIRGNNDKAWTRGLRWLIRNYLEKLE